MTPRAKPRRRWVEFLTELESKELAVVVRQFLRAVTFILSTAAVGGYVKNSVDQETKSERDATQNTAMYQILNAQQRQIDSLKAAFADSDRKRARRHRVEVAEAPRRPGVLQRLGSALASLWPFG